MKWYRVELNKEDAEKLKAFLNLNKVYYEPSSCFNLIHFEIKLEDSKVKMVEEFLENL